VQTRTIEDELYKLRTEQFDLKERLKHVTDLIAWLEFAEKCGATQCIDPDAGDNS
jgi:hypothetical protein